MEIRDQIPIRRHGRTAGEQIIASEDAKRFEYELNAAGLDSKLREHLNPEEIRLWLEQHNHQLIPFFYGLSEDLSSSNGGEIAQVNENDEQFDGETEYQFINFG